MLTSSGSVNGENCVSEGTSTDRVRTYNLARARFRITAVAFALIGALALGGCGATSPSQNFQGVQLKVGPCISTAIVTATIPTAVMVLRGSTFVARVTADAPAYRAKVELSPGVYEFHIKAEVAGSRATLVAARVSRGQITKVIVSPWC